MSDSDNDMSPMERYHRYLSDNYVGGAERFFSPTGFLSKFQKAVELQTQKIRNSPYAKTIDDAVNQLKPIIEGQEGVYDLCALPGTGKTSVLPFRFPTKRVLVAAPTQFDAWSAYNMATGDCSLKLKGLRMGTSTQVVYTDSYMASYLLMTGLKDFDILMVDECDCDRGVTKFLAEVKLPDKFLVRMSATMDDFGSKKSGSFRVTDHDDMPDIRGGVKSLAEYIKKHHSGRSMVLAPDADSAIELHKMLPGSIAVHTKSNLGHIARVMVKQEGTALYVADDTCARGLNLNLDNMFDTQLVSEYSVVRPVTSAEGFQRRGRVGRNRDGHYRSPGLKTVEKDTSDMDVVRHNVVRAIAGVPQEGKPRLQMSEKDAVDLMTSDSEPYEVRSRMLHYESALTSQSSSSPDVRSLDSRRSGDYGSDRVSPPSWLAHYENPKATRRVGTKGADTFLLKNNKNYAWERRKSSRSSDADSVSSGSRSRSGSIAMGLAALSLDRPGRTRAVMRTRPDLPEAESAPYAATRHRREVSYSLPTVPLAPPLMDLTELTYDMDWPSLIRDRLIHGGDLPTLVPPGSWRHTSATGLGTDWFRRLDDLAHKDYDFDEREFEVICRAWNKLVGQAWVKRTPGLSSEQDVHRMECCIRYFQSYFLLSSAG